MQCSLAASMQFKCEDGALQRSTIVHEWMIKGRSGLVCPDAIAFELVQSWF